jgi:DNA-binding transcriptional LysR family regulator
MDELPYAENDEEPSLGEVSWDDFRIFLEVVRIGSFNRAAVRLKMSQATVSRRLVRLEKGIRVRLFNDALVAQTALSRASQATNTTGRVEGDCKIFMGDGLASYWMTRFLVPFFARYPNIQLRLFGASDASADKRELFDLNVHYYEPAEAEPVAVRLGTMHFVPFASRDYLKENQVPRSVEDLDGHRLLDLAVYLADIGSWTTWSRNDPGKRTVLFTNLSAVLAEAVRHGAGIALLPTYAHLVDETLVPLEIGVRFQAPIFVSYQRDASKKWAVRSTIDYLRTNVFDRKNMPWFRDAFAMPTPEWSRRLTELVKQAAVPDLTREAIQRRLSPP